jgi:hypothetical protein
MVVMTIPVSIKLKMMEVKSWKWISVIFVVPILVLKAYALSELAEFEVEYSIMNMWGNQLFSAYMTYAIYMYYRFFMDFVAYRVKMDLIDEKDAEKVKNRSKFWLLSVTLLTITGFVFSILSFFAIQHAVGVALNSSSTCLLHLLNIWMDQAFAKSKFKVSQTFVCSLFF